MRRFLSLFRPRSVAQWVLVVSFAMLVLLVTSNSLGGFSTLSQLRASGFDETLPIAQVLERAADGTPTRIRIDRHFDGKEHVLTDLDGSLVGEDSVRVRMLPSAQVMMSRTAYRGSSLVLESLPAVALIVGVCLAILALLNLRSIYLMRPVPSVWAHASRSRT